jgi:hypothetical protein
MSAMTLVGTAVVNAESALTYGSSSTPRNSRLTMSQFGPMGTEHGVWRRRASQASCGLLTQCCKPRPLRPDTQSGMASMRWLSKQFRFSRRSSTHGLKGVRVRSTIDRDRLRGMNEPDSAVWDVIPLSEEFSPIAWVGRPSGIYIYIRIY